MHDSRVFYDTPRWHLAAAGRSFESAYNDVALLQIEINKTTFDAALNFFNHNHGVKCIEMVCRVDRIFKYRSRFYYAAENGFHGSSAQFIAYKLFEHNGSESARAVEM